MERSSRELLPRRAAEIFGINLTVEELRRIDEFLALLTRWSARINLVGARSADEITDRHVLDSLALTKLARSAEAAADLGSGAGFPGVLMAITAPGTRVHLVEARRKESCVLAGSGASGSTREYPRVVYPCRELAATGSPAARSSSRVAARRRRRACSAAVDRAWPARVDAKAGRRRFRRPGF